MEQVSLIMFLLLFLAVFCLFNLKRGIRKVQLDLEQKFITKTHILLTSPIGDRDLARLIETINIHQNELMEQEMTFAHKNDHLQKMITNISHDLRTPLTSALGYLDLLSHSSLSEEEKRKDLIIIQERLNYLSELIESFFEFSRIILYENVPSLERVNLVAVIETAISNHYDDYSIQHRTIQFHTSQSRIFLNSNATLLIRIFDNLIHNAYQHSTSDLTITLTKESLIRIVMQNELLESDLDPEQIFDEFYTMDISRTKGNTGLGLAIAKEFTNQLNGVIHAEKKQGNLKIILEFSEIE